MENQNRMQFLIETFKQFPEIFKSHNQIYQEVELYFKGAFECKYLPKDFLEFMSNIDGINLGFLRVYSITDEDKKCYVSTFMELSTPERVENFMSNMNMNSKGSRLFFFGDDGGVGKYAFKMDIEDDKVYYLNPDMPSAVVISDSFTNFLYDNYKRFVKENVE